MAGRRIDDGDYLDVVAGAGPLWPRLAKAAIAIAAVAAAVALAFVLSGHASSETGSGGGADAPQGAVLHVAAQAEGYDVSTSTPLLAVLENGSTRTAYDAGPSQDAQVPVPDGSWTVSFVTPVNADGSIYDVPAPIQVDSSAGTLSVAGTELPGSTLEVRLVPVDAASVDDARSAEVSSAIESALECADSDLASRSSTVTSMAAQALSAGQQARQAQASAEEGASAPKAADKETGADEAEETSSSAGAGDATAPADDGARDEGRSSSASSKPAHTHSWKPVYGTVHHGAQYRTQWICKTCGAAFSSSTAARSHVSSDHAGKVGAGVREQLVKVKDAYDSTGIVGYKCSCGATR